MISINVGPRNGFPLTDIGVTLRCEVNLNPSLSEFLYHRKHQLLFLMFGSYLLYNDSFLMVSDGIEIRLKPVVRFSY